MEQKNLARYIDYSPIKMDSSESEIIRYCNEAVEYAFYSIVVFPHYIKLARKYILNSEVRIVTVAGFPFGNDLSSIKSDQAKRCLSLGAHEIDMVMNLSAFKSGDYDHVRKDIDTVLKRVRTKNAVLKVIIEIELLSDDEIIQACNLVADAGADFVKTSVGLLKHSRPAEVEKVKLMYDTVKDRGVKVKASGSIHTAEQLIKMIDAGASRIGTSKGVNIVSGEVNIR